MWIKRVASNYFFNNILLRYYEVIIEREKIKLQTSNWGNNTLFPLYFYHYSTVIDKA